MLLRRTIPTQNFHLQTNEPMRSGLFFLFILLTLGVQAQERCGTIAPSTGEFESWMSTKIAERRSQAYRPQATLYQIPVVVHVFHKGEPVGSGVNLSEERIKAQIDSLTADFRRLNADAVNTPTEFLPVAADIEIEFVLAKQDPAGNPSNGIIRLRGSKNSYNMGSSLNDRPLIRSESYWPPEHYLNVFVLDLQGFLGYASFPLISLEGITNDPEDYIFDGVLVDYEYFGVNPSAGAFESYGRTLTHEVGHYLGLRHIWGDGNCSVDDFVDDTPLADNDNGDYTSPCTFPNPDDDEVCVMGEPEMFQNYMDYTDDICMNLFTEGQKTRMRTVMDNAENRLSLTSSPGLISPPLFTDDLAVSDVLSPNYYECTSEIAPGISVINLGLNEITSFDIQLYLDGSPFGAPQNIITSLAPFDNQTVSFPLVDLSSIPADISFEIIAVNGNTDGNSSNNIISRIVYDTINRNIPFIENFEGTPAAAGEYGATKPWEVKTAPRLTGDNLAAVFKAFNNTNTTQKDVAIDIPPLDLTGFDAVDLSFSYSYANDLNAFDDGLLIRYSNDCGESYETTPLYFEFGSDLATVTQTSDSEFTPSNQSDWQDVKILVPKDGDTYSDQVRISLTGLNGSGNNIYIDNILVNASDRKENDATFTNIYAPKVTCRDTSNVEVEIRNIGFAEINQLAFGYLVNGAPHSITFNGLQIGADEYETLELEVGNEMDINNLSIEIQEVNGGPDESENDNLIESSTIKDLLRDEFPLSLDFDNVNNWQIAEPISLWNDTTLSGNHLLVGSGYSQLRVGKKNWFVSPVLSNGKLDSAGLSFKASYGKRGILNDKLDVLISTNCGEKYSTLLSLNADSLSIKSSNNQWKPGSSNDWKEFQVSLSHYIGFGDDLRIAFVFESAGGNDLYIDDISIRGNELPSYKDVMRAYPNPAISRFKVGLNLPVKEPVTLRLQDISGKIIFEERIENALNQILEYEAPNQEGLYILSMIGRQFKTSQKLFISR